MKRANILFFLGLLIPTLLIFKSIFLPGTVVWGDAPYFYPEGLRELLNYPTTWTSRGHNFGGINEFLWIYPLMFIYGGLHQILGFSNDIIIRLLFYIPAVGLSLIGPILLARYLGYSRIVQFFAGLFYTLNTYFILLVDGGQIGVALSYGIFPIALMFLHRLLTKPKLNNFVGVLIIFFALWVSDIRVAVICFLTLILWLAIDYLITRDLHLIRGLKFLIILLVVVLGLSAYWVVPLMFALLTGRVNISEISELQLTSLLNSLLVFQPHWPNNEFGKVSSPPFYFVGIPLLLFSGLVLRKIKLINLEFLILFLFFGFLAKGTTPPLGEIYQWLMLNLPFGTAFRDPTKFFIPLILFGGILIGNSIELLLSKYKRYSYFVLGTGYVYLIFLIQPAILGNLNGVLKQRELSNDFKIVHGRLNSENGFSRTAWFPTIHPFTFQTEDKQAIDASQLIKLRPLSSLNVGNDVFNFMHQSTEFLDWFNLLGIKYLILSGNPRTVNPSNEEIKSSEDLTSHAAAIPDLVKEDWGTSFPVYSIPDIKPHIFAVDKALIILGSEDIYQKIHEANPEFSVGNQAFFFLEDGKFDSNYLNDAASGSTVIVFNNAGEIDLTLSFLQKYFVSPKDAKKSDWSIRDSNEYLRWKYELLNHGVDTKEFDYGLGIAFSTVAGEKIKFSFNTPEAGEYIFAVRMLSEKGEFGWTTEQITLQRGQWDKEFTNAEGLDVINTVALIPKKNWEESEERSKRLMSKYNVVKINGVGDTEKLKQLSNLSQWKQIEYQIETPADYKISLPQEDSWIIFTDSFSKEWKINTNNQYLGKSQPAYSVVNGFFTYGKNKNASIHFRVQDELKFGVKLTIVTAIAVTATLLGLYVVKSKDE